MKSIPTVLPSSGESTAYVASPATECSVRQAPIGVFDSGVGGLSVLREIHRLLPSENLLYLADSAYCPYGGRPVEQIQARAATITRWLLARGAKLVVVACNTATVTAIQYLRGRFDVPFVGLEPAIKPAAALTRSGVVGVMATEVTARGERLRSLVQRYASGVQVLTQPCPGLADRVEAGDLDGPETRALLRDFTAPLLARGADTIVLGCTHYPFLRPAIQEIVGPAVLLLETGEPVARQAARVLAERTLANPSPGQGTIRFFTTADAASVGPTISRLWGSAINVEAADLE